MMRETLPNFVPYRPDSYILVKEGGKKIHVVRKDRLVRKS